MPKPMYVNSTGRSTAGASNDPFQTRAATWYSVSGSSSWELTATPPLNSVMSGLSHVTANPCFIKYACE